MLFKRKSLQNWRPGLLFLLVISLSCWLASLGTTHASLLQKLDPVLKPFVLGRDLARRAPTAIYPMVRPHEPGLINAIIKVSGNPMAIESAGARVRSVIGDIVTADIPLRSLNDLIHLPNVIYIQAARQMELALLDVSVPDTKADQVWGSVPGYTGKGVIVGVVDAGIDWRHPDFSGDDGTSRILYIWDQTARTPGQYPSVYGYGTEWTKEHIDSGQCQEMDATSHGTHIASTMAGNGGNRHEFTGMAPEADIIVVKTGLADADVIDAADYIFCKAAELNRPAVINMSFGSHWGPHDGTVLLDQALDELIGGHPGRAIVASAGNDGDGTKHVGTPSLRQPIGESYPWTAVRPSVGAQLVAVQIWYASAKSLSVRLLLPENDRGDLGDLDMVWVSEGQFRYFLVPDGPLAGAEVVIDAQQPWSESLYPAFDGIYIHISDNGDLTIPIDEYIYAIEYDGAGVGLDTYVLSSGSFTTKLPGSVSLPSRSFLLEGDGDKTIISPASADGVICVGSYVTKSEWIDSENRIRTESLKMDDISVFSSRGPLLNGNMKPDIAAPGEMIVAAFSAESWGRSRSIYRDGEHISWRGTSMSSPHVAGAVALMYQQNPNLTTSEVKDMLTSAAIDQGQAGWDKAWGYGKLDVLAAMGIPSTPRGLRVTADDDSITVTWLPNKENDIAGYRIYSMLVPAYAGIGYSILDSPVPSIQYPASSIQHPVSLWVSAYDTDGNESPRSQEITVMPGTPGPDVTPPAPPGDLAVVPVDTALDLTWSRCTDHDLAGYKVYYGTSTGNYDKSIRAGNQTEYRLENLTNGVRLYIAVSSIDTSGNESDKSKEVSAVPRLFPKGAELRYQSGWPVSMGHDVHASPTLFDIDGDGRFMEVSIAARDGKIYLLRHDGLHMSGWPISTGFASVSSPAVGDIDGDGRAEIVVGAGNFVHVWHTDGDEALGWPVEVGGSILASPALGDIDGDGRMEVVVGSRDGKVYAYNSDASPVGGWPVATYGYVHSSAALGDIDGDSRLEVVVGSEDGNLYVFNGDGTNFQGWPVYVGSAIYSSPAIGDIDGYGGMEIIAADEGGRVYAWHYDGDPVSGWPVDLRESIASSPALGNIDDDRSALEVVIGTEYGSVYVLESDGATMDGWPVSVEDIITSSPALGDIDGDGKVEVVVATSTGQQYVGLVYAFRSTGKMVGAVWPVYTEGNICYSSPALGDLDGDGDVELVIGSCRLANGAGGQVHAWDLGARVSLPASPESIPWGGFRHDPRHTGVADDTVPPSFVIVALQNAALKKHISLYVIASERLMAAPELIVERHSSIPSPLMVQKRTVLEEASKSPFDGVPLKKSVMIFVGTGFIPVHISCHQAGINPAPTTICRTVITEESSQKPLKRGAKLPAPERSQMWKGQDGGEENFIQTIPLTQIDALSHIYQAHFVAESDGSYTFTVSGTDMSGNIGRSSKTISVETRHDVSLQAPANFSLLPNYPNPFNPGTWIPYELAQPADVTVGIYNVAGQLIRSLELGRRAAGSYTSRDAAAYWDGRDDSAQEMASGVYFCVLKAGDFRAVRKMILSR